MYIKTTITGTSINLLRSICKSDVEGALCNICASCSVAAARVFCSSFAACEGCGLSTVSTGNAPVMAQSSSNILNRAFVLCSFSAWLSVWCKYLSLLLIIGLSFVFCHQYSTPLATSFEEWSALNVDRFSPAADDDNDDDDVDEDCYRVRVSNRCCWPSFTVSSQSIYYVAKFLTRF